MKQHLDGSKIPLSALDRRLVKYVAAVGSATSLLASQAEAAVVSHNSPHSFGVNGDVNVDFNMDGQTDFQIDHDRVDLNGTQLDYLQVDKNDVSSAENPLAFPQTYLETFPLNGTQANGDHQYIGFTNDFGDLGGYPVGLKAGDMIGATGRDSLIPGTIWDFQEGSGFSDGGVNKHIRANRLIDEDNGQIDEQLSGATVFHPLGPQPEFPALGNFLGNNGETRYLGVRVDLNDMGHFGLNPASQSQQWWYGWIGIQIDNEADATGTVTGWAYETTPGIAIEAGDIGTPIGQPGDFDGDNDVDGSDFLFWQRGNTTPPLDPTALTQWQSNYGTPLLANTTAIPEPGSLLTAAVGGFCLLSGFAARRLFPGRCPKQ